MHILSTKDLPDSYLDRLYGRTLDIEKYSYRYTDALKGKVLANLFFEESTRTRISFETAMYRLGGQVLSPNIKDSSLVKGESIENMIKTISQYADVIVIRHPVEGMVSKLAKHSDVPVINAGDGANEHPTQALLDLHTMLKFNQKELFERTNLMFTGDLLYSRTIRSLLYLIKRYTDIRVCFANDIEEKNIPFSEYFIADEKSIPEFLSATDILYMTRNQKERHIEGKNDTKFILTSELADTMPDHAIIMHPLPCNDELPEEINNNPRAKYFEQVKNGLWTRMAILWLMLRDYDNK